MEQPQNRYNYSLYIITNYVYHLGQKLNIRGNKNYYYIFFVKNGASRLCLYVETIMHCPMSFSNEQFLRDFTKN